MPQPLVDTKSLAPLPRAALVARPRLDERLRRGATARLTLVSAPAGFGKSTALATWAASAQPDQRSIAWLSLEPSDDDPSVFWRYVAASLHRAVPELTPLATLLDARHSPPAESIPVILVNALHPVTRDIVLVLDDYHSIGSPAIHEQMASFIDHLPPRAHVAIATRSDPPLSLARLRARGELMEVRATDLRFTADEVVAYLNGCMNLDLDAASIATLEDRTEGWIAALQLAALSLDGRDDAAGFIAGYAGDDRFVVDYLVDEVLSRQDEHVREFLLRTSVLDRLSGPLCDAVTGQHDGRATLEALDRANLFLVPLDRGRRWFRYHHLFADVLRMRLLDEQPDTVTQLHRRAGSWFERHGMRDEALHHAVAGDDRDRAADLLERAIPELQQARQEVTLRRWCEALPDEVFRVRPVLNVGYVGSRMANGDFQDVDERLAEAERWLGQDAPAEGMQVADPAALARLPGAIAMYRAAQAQLRGDRDGSTTHARRALELAGDGDPVTRGGAAGFLALAHWAVGDLEVAHDHWVEAMASLARAGHTVDAVAIVRALAAIRQAQGRLRDARRWYEDGLALSVEGPVSPLRGAADMHTGLAELALEVDDTDGAAGHLRESARLDELGASLPQDASRRRVVTALLRAAEGDPAAALDLLGQAERSYVGEYFPVVRPIPALRARLLIAQGRLVDAGDWVRDRALSVDDDLDYLHEFEHVTLARLLMASATPSDQAPMRAATALLHRLRLAAEAGGRGSTLVEILVLLALAHRTRRDDLEALRALREALELAEPDDRTHVFLAEGAPMRALLDAAIARGITTPFVRRLQSASARPRRQPLPESLSARELEVLHLLASDLDGPAIAEHLVVALSTVRSHTKSIYTKLDVTSRRAAVRRAEEIGLLSSGGPD